jgi:hypothetical protein
MLDLDPQGRNISAGSGSLVEFRIQTQVQSSEVGLTNIFSDDRPRVYFNSDGLVSYGRLRIWNQMRAVNIAAVID